MKLKNIASLLLLTFMMIHLSCKKDDPPPVTPPVLDGGVYILNEGNYQWGNARIDYLRFADNVYTSDVFTSINQRPLGDVVQSMTTLNGRGYLVVNNSAKIEVVEMTGFTSMGTITGLTSPRYMLPINSTLAYVSDLYSNTVNIVNLSNLQKTGSIPLKGSSEEMIMIGETVFVTNTRTSYIYLISTVTNSVTDSIAVGFASNSIVKDKEGMLWVMCAGSQSPSINAALYRIDPIQKQVINSFSLSNYLDIWDKLRINGSGERIYFLNHGVWSMEITAGALPGSALIAQNSSVFHGLGIDPNSGTIYASDALDYVQHGRVYRYNSDGSSIDTLAAGIIPSEFYFY